MIFIETLNKYDKEVKKAVDELFKAAFNNQQASTELLLVIIHGFYDAKNREFHEREKLSPYVFGPAQIGYSLEAFYEFFHSYRITYISKSDFVKRLKDKKEQVEHTERMTLNLELLIYLKFWESDMILRQLYNLVNLSSSKYYDWSFELSYSRRKFIRNEIQLPLKTLCPKTFALIEETYSAQIRNAVAHSKYYFLGRDIQLGNLEENPFYELHTISSDDWEVRFHKTLLFYNHLIGNLQKYEKKYVKEVKDKHFGLPLSTPKMTRVGTRKNQWVKYEKRYKRWLWSDQIDDK